MRHGGAGDGRSVDRTVSTARWIAAGGLAGGSLDASRVAGGGAATAEGDGTAGALVEAAAATAPTAPPPASGGEATGAVPSTA